ncbi:hypothetical protein [Nostoc sp. TCL240-02]|uniref:hypothetical protein n=1 Tax=Nostoc sp. TCL240-02 TaxID=2572090 RepID=UPI00157FBC80|nr:hypothetical protein [Nostoc sp. TCL240-02]QKQ73312.1 hypothetical protein FBB35_07980 [Nostoc sp. TCL240-02]
MISKKAFFPLQIPTQKPSILSLPKLSNKPASASPTTPKTSAPNTLVAILTYLLAVIESLKLKIERLHLDREFFYPNFSQVRNPEV